MMEERKYSVLMSVYGKEKAVYLDASIRSILSQTVPASDFVLVCDGPLNDLLEEVIHKYKEQYPELLQIIRLKKCGGLGNALNEGLQQCKCELVARMDSDDISMADRCEKQLEVMKRLQVDIVSGGVWEFEDSIEEVTAYRALPEKHDEIMKYAKKRNPFNHPCIMYRKSMVETAGGYKDFPFFEDYYLWVRMLRCGAKAYNIQEPLLYMRAGEGMYARRGGKSYAGDMFRFRWYMKKTGFSGWDDFLVSTGGQLLICLIPNKMRKMIYKKLLRK